MSPQIEEKKEFMSQLPYSSVVESLMYGKVCIRPNIAYTVSFVSRYMTNLYKAKLQAMKFIFKYSGDSTNVGMVFGRETYNVTSHVTRLCNLDYAGNLDHRKALNGYIFILGDSAISFRTTLQSIITFSTT